MAPSNPVSTQPNPETPSAVRRDARIPNALTIDVEDYYQVGVFQARVAPEEWPAFESRVERNVERLLEMLAVRGVHATFFVLGWIAERHPALVRRLDALGHEVGSHGYSHKPVWTMSPDEFRADVARAQATIGGALGRPCTSYRAPCFSIVKRTLWALEILADHGIEADSSIFPVRHPEYGIPEAERAIHRMRLESGRTLWEFPMTTSRLFGKNVAVCGGGYFRLLPYWVTRRALRSAEGGGQPFVFYTHPWEIDPAQPRLRERATALGRFRHYLNLDRTEGRLARLLDDFSFGTMSDALARVRDRGAAREVTYRP